MTHPPEGHLAEYAVNELPDGEAAAVRAHVAECPECSRMVETLAALAERLEDVDLPPASDRFVASVMSRIEPAGRTVDAGFSIAAIFRDLLAPALSAAFALLVVFTDSEPASPSVRIAEDGSSAVLAAPGDVDDLMSGSDDLAEAVWEME